MKIYKTKIKDLLIIKGKIHKDSRGYFREVLVEELLNKNLYLMWFLNQKKCNKRFTLSSRKTTRKIYFSYERENIRCGGRFKKKIKNLWKTF